METLLMVKLDHAQKLVLLECAISVCSSRYSIGPDATSDVVGNSGVID
jgi:hypothetical protein